MLKREEFREAKGTMSGAPEELMGERIKTLVETSPGINREDNRTDEIRERAVARDDTAITGFNGAEERLPVTSKDHVAMGTGLEDIGGDRAPDGIIASSASET